jgi:hypothetical protein
VTRDDRGSASPSLVYPERAEPAIESSTDEPPPELINEAADAAAAFDEGSVERTIISPEPGEPTKPAGVSDRSTPTVAAAAARLPESTHRLLDELFKAKITAVKRISREQLR